MTSRLLVAIAAASLLYIPARGQSNAPGFAFPIVNDVQEGSILSVPVTVSNFSGIVSLGMGFRWDPKVLRYISTSNHTLPDLDVNDFGTTHAADSGLLRLVWWKLGAPQDSLGQTLPDGTAMFKIRFLVLGGNLSSSPLEFVDQRPDLIFEVGRANGPRLLLPALNIQNGMVAVGYTVSQENLPKSSLEAVTLYPNPSSVGQDVYVAMPDGSSDISRVLVTDMLGNTQVSFSKNEIELLRSDTCTLPLGGDLPRGVYSITIQSGNRTVSRRLVRSD